MIDRMRTKKWAPTGRREPKWLPLPVVVLTISTCLAICAVLAGFPQSGPVVARGRLEQIPIVRCDPLTKCALIDDELTIDLYVEDVQEVEPLYGVDFFVEFDTSIAQVIDQSGAPEVQIEVLYDWLIPGFVVRNTADNSVGTIWFAATQTYPTPPVWGSGPVARVHFSGVQAGSSPLTFTNHQLSAPGGVPIEPHDVMHCTICFEDPTGVIVGGFTAEPGPGAAITLRWETSTEVDLLGFNLYRADTEDGTQVRLNDSMIEVEQPGSPVGHEYAWTDNDVGSGATYFYWLERVETGGPVTRHGPESATAPFGLYLPFAAR